MTKYTIQYYLDKFEAIPEEKWTTGQFISGDEERFCAYGLCGATPKLGLTDEAEALRTLFFKAGFQFSPALVNDGVDPSYQQPTPKQRILAACRDVAGFLDVRPAPQK